MANAKSNESRKNRLKQISHLNIAFKLIFFSFMFAVGVTLIFKYSSNFAIRFNYSDRCPKNSICDIQFTLLGDIEGPLYVYYYVSRLYIMNWGFLSSISKRQLNGINDANSNMLKCGKFLSNGNLNKSFSINGSILVPSAEAFPCGLRSGLMFNGSF